MVAWETRGCPVETVVAVRGVAEQWIGREVAVEVVAADSVTSFIRIEVTAAPVNVRVIGALNGPSRAECDDRPVDLNIGTPDSDNAARASIVDRQRAAFDEPGTTVNCQTLRLT
jgi:hypothetical protein